MNTRIRRSIRFATLYVCFSTAAFAAHTEQQTKPRKHAMPMPGMQMGHENHTPASDLRTAFTNAWNAADANKLAALFGESAVVILPSGSFLTGKQSIYEFWRQRVNHKVDISFASSGYESSSDLQVDFGIFAKSHAARSADGQVRNYASPQDSSAQGKYLMVVKRINADWKIQEMVFVSSEQNF